MSLVQTGIIGHHIRLASKNSNKKSTNMSLAKGIIQSNLYSNLNGTSSTVSPLPGRFTLNSVNSLDGLITENCPNVGIDWGSI